MNILNLMKLNLKMTKFLNRNNKATITGYVAALLNSAILINWDILDWSKVSAYVTVIYGLLGPIFIGHGTQFKSPNLNER